MSSLVFHDHLTVVNILGLFVTLAGIGFYHFMKLREMKETARLAAKEIAQMDLATASNHRGAHAGRTSDHEHQRKRSTGRSAMTTEERPQREVRVDHFQAEGEGTEDASKAEERSATVPSNLEGSPLIFGLGEEEEEEGEAAHAPATGARL